MLERAILDAALEQLSAVCWSGLTMEGITARAQTGKAAVYRRWPSKEDLVADALQAGLPTLDEAADHGSIREDLFQPCRRVRDAMFSTSGFDGNSAPGERGAGGESFFMVEHGDNGSAWRRRVQGVQSIDHLARVAQQGYPGCCPFGGLKHPGEAAGGAGRRGDRSGCGRSESEGHGPPFAYAPTVRAGSSGGAPRHGPFGPRTNRAGSVPILAATCPCGNEQFCVTDGNRRV